MNRYIEYAPKIADALEAGKPVVAIESAGTFEGIPYPDNMASAHEVMDAVRSAGAVPAYIALIDGKIKVGLRDEEVSAYAQRAKALPKVSVRELPTCMAMGGSGVVTIGGTMMLADTLGIPVALGGGMGGVHRGAETSMDISADLEEISTRDVILVCSGVKYIMNLELTMEYLETKGVPVIAFGTDELPAYTLRDSGIKAPCRMDSVESIARAYEIKNSLQIKTGILVANPVAPEYADDADKLNAVIKEAVKDCEREGIKGKPVTKHMMYYIKDRMGEESQAAQRNMMIQNALLAGRIAVELGKNDE